MSYWSALPAGLGPAHRQLVEELRALKDEHRLTLTRLAQLTHYSTASWQRWLNGRRPITEPALGILVGALGVDGARLFELLRGAAAAPAPEPPAPAPPAGGPAGAAPAQLPAAVADFTGRRAQLAELAGLLGGGGAAGPGQVVLVAVTGAGGVGKTALAVTAGHLAARHFPDGQLFADLGGGEPAPRAAAEVLAGWLRALGELGVPAGEEEAAARFRTLLAGRRMLLVLDNAASAAQLRPLIPGSAGCAVLVTARNRLSDLVGAHHLALPMLDAAEARELLAAAVGERRVAAEPEAVQRVLAGCAGLPLALRIAAARLTRRAGWTIEALAARLDDERARLDELAVGDLAIRAAFRTGYRTLPDARPRTAAGQRADRQAEVSTARAFRLLGLFPGPRFGAHAAAALLDVPLRRAEDLLEVLAEAHLVESDGPERYRLHDLLRSYAAELAQQEESEEQRRAAGGRLAAWYLYACHRAQAEMHVFRTAAEIGAAARPEPAVAFAGHAEATAWFDAEQRNLPAVTRLAAELDLGPVTWLLPRCTYNYQLLRALWRDVVEMAELAAAAARAHGELDVLPAMLACASLPYVRLGRVDEAAELCRQAFELAERLGYRWDGGFSALMLAETLDGAGRFEEAEGWFRAAVELHRDAEVPRQELGRALHRAAWALLDAGRPAAALPLAVESLGLARAGDDRYQLAVALDALALAHHDLGRFEEELAVLREAVRVHADNGDHYLAADTLEQAAWCEEVRREEARCEEVRREEARFEESEFEEAHAAVRPAAPLLHTRGVHSVSG
ncbi:ATP-binding protein [Kitasatospora viridis]|uniref:ATP-binding protein n=1 Tax=Kitasatospora viridis TaxID=281105 RepID=UPI0011A4004F|nr:helix-turn-helix domain-containing protein [Kitasatospora viridis]